MRARFKNFESFFNRHIAVFVSFVKHNISKRINDSMKQLKLIETFSTIGQVDQYVHSMKHLKPIADQLYSDVNSLNRLQTAVGVRRTDISTIRSIASHVNALSQLFVAYQHFHQYQTYHSFILYLSSMTSLITQPSAKNFIMQARNEADKLRKKLDIIDVMTCAHLKPAYWASVSEIIGFDMRIYEEATISELLELSLDSSVINELKLICASAEQLVHI
ncbi:unnamed protein product [Anisakis simplex]|uniref:Uncharacterized protein n=1 Tax=Anisakis simplex TaxID=6269 RepID=A0A3P6NG44_ANISI|nr:unnamed protein product [Anisakis simplex]